MERSMDVNHELVNRRVRSRDGDKPGRIIAVDEHGPSGRILGVRVEWDAGIETPEGILWETNVFWSRVELID
jgi:hypothetical protein